MRKLAVGVVALALVIAACGDDDVVSDPGSIGSCDGLAVAGIALLQETIDLIDSMDAAALAALGEGADAPPEFTALQTRGDDLTARADEIGCSDEEMAQLMADKVGDLSSDSVFGQFILESVRAGEGGFFDE